MVRSAKHDVQRRSIYDEDAQACAGEYACKVVVVADDGLAEREGELGFHGEYIEALDDENREIHFPHVNQLLQLRLWHRLITHR